MIFEGTLDQAFIDLCKQKDEEIQISNSPFPLWYANNIHAKDI
jgi:hypothetical protein